MVLGVAEDESPRGIRAAYRDLARRTHPDVAGGGSLDAFREATEAYEVLSDAARRRAYNERIHREDVVAEAGVVARRPRPIVLRPRSIELAPGLVEPSFEELFDRLLRNFTGVAVPKAERLEGLNVEVVLSPEEAAEGCIAPIGVPVFRRCPRCRGTGREWIYACSGCGRSGFIESEAIVRIRVPAMVPSGTVIEVPLTGLGIHNFYLRLHVVVEA
jgi:DnaJ-class molecular chaperone